MDSTTKYLARYAEPQTNEHLVERRFRAALIVPAYAESPSAINQLVLTAEDNDALLIVVVNAPSNASAERIATTDSLLDYCLQHPSEHLLPINRLTNPIPRRQGVGLARKIGCDIALNLYVQGLIESPWIYTSDADAVLPKNYFSHPLSNSGAHVFSHRHLSSDDALQSAVNAYDQHMAYYVAGLEYAGSQYAYPTLGSTIVIHATTYAQIRGFPKRNAAEDFYLLNKTAKVSEVRFTPDVEITLEARVSTRVPFGTGPALASILEQNSPYLSYNFQAFEALKTTLAALDDFADTGVLKIDPELFDVISSLGWQDREARFAEGYQPTQRKRVVHDWFDALKTLQFMHHSADVFPDAPLLETIATLPNSVVATINRHLPRELHHK